VEECQDYPTLKAALLTAYALVPEVYRKRFRNLTKHNSETFSEYAFRLSVQFPCWLESEEAYDNLDRLRDLLQLEQFQTCLDADLRSWLLDQKPKNLSEAARLANQHVAVHTAERPGQSSRFGMSGQFPPRGFPSKPQLQSSKPQNAASSATGKPHQTSSVGAKPKFSDPVFRGTHRIACHYCKKPGHILANCRKRLDKLSGKTSEEAPVHLVSTLLKPQLVDVAPIAVLSQKEQSPDPRFERHRIYADLVRPDLSTKRVRFLRDTGALQSLICSRILTDVDYVSTGEFRLIRGVTGDIVRVPLVKVTLVSPMCCGTFCAELYLHFRPELPSSSRTTSVLMILLRM